MLNVSAIIVKGRLIALTRQNQTNPDTSRPELTPRQAAAVELLAVGRTITEVAEAVGVTRQTVSVWRNQQAEFQAALNRKRRELWEERRDRFRAMLSPALDVIQTELEKGNLTAALAVVKTAGFQGLEAPDEFIDPQDIEIERTKRENERRASRFYLSRLNVSLETDLANSI